MGQAYIHGEMHGSQDLRVKFGLTSRRGVFSGVFYETLGC